MFFLFANGFILADKLRQGALAEVNICLVYSSEYPVTKNMNFICSKLGWKGDYSRARPLCARGNGYLLVWYQHQR